MATAGVMSIMFLYYSEEHPTKGKDVVPHTLDTNLISTGEFLMKFPSVQHHVAPTCHDEFFKVISKTCTTFGAAMHPYICQFRFCTVWCWYVSGAGHDLMLVTGWCWYAGKVVSLCHISFGLIRLNFDVELSVPDVGWNGHMFIDGMGNRMCLDRKNTGSTGFARSGLFGKRSQNQKLISLGEKLAALSAGAARQSIERTLQLMAGSQELTRPHKTVDKQTVFTSIKRLHCTFVHR